VLYVHVRARAYVYIHMYTHTFMCVRITVISSFCLGLHLLFRVVYIHINTRMHTHVHINVYIHIYTYMYMHMHDKDEVNPGKTTYTCESTYEIYLKPSEAESEWFGAPRARLLHVYDCSYEHSPRNRGETLGVERRCLLLNLHRSLLQKSPIKETIFCVAYCWIYNPCLYVCELRIYIYRRTVRTHNRANVQYMIYVFTKCTCVCYSTHMWQAWSAQTRGMYDIYTRTHKL